MQQKITHILSEFIHDSKQKKNRRMKQKKKQKTKMRRSTELTDYI